jgi:ribonuclease HI
MAALVLVEGGWTAGGAAAGLLSIVRLALRTVVGTNKKVEPKKIRRKEKKKRRRKAEASLALTRAKSFSWRWLRCHCGGHLVRE